jgi:diguanylate cyclase (GGDEF)-like protein
MPIEKVLGITPRDQLGHYRMLLDAQVHRMRNALARTFQREEFNIQNQLHQAVSPEDIARISQKTLSSLIGGGVNTYRYNNGSGNLLSVIRDEMQGESRYRPPRLIEPGEKRSFLTGGNRRNYTRSQADILLVDRLDLPSLAPEDRPGAQFDLESDLVKYFGADYQEKYADRLDQLREALRYNLYVRYPAYRTYDMLIMANLHAKNAKLIQAGEPPVKLLGNRTQAELVMTSLRNLQSAFTNEFIKVDLMVRNEAQRIRIQDAHSLQMALDRMVDPKELFEMLLDDLPNHFIRDGQQLIERSSLLLFDKDEGVLRIVSSRGLRGEIISGTVIKPREGIAGRVFETGEPLLVDRAQTSDIIRSRENQSKVSEGSFMSVRIQFEDNKYGVLNVRSRQEKAFKPEDLEHLQSLAALLGIKLTQVNDRNLDGLTELNNRRAGQAKLAKLMEAAKSEQQALAIIMVDIDHFKEVNDTFGHEAGDKVLQGTAQALHRFILKHRYQHFKDYAEIRWGGEEFILGLLGVPLEMPYISQLAEDLRTIIGEQEYQFFGAKIKRTASIGVSVFPSHGSDLSSLLQRADELMYRSKEAGRDRITLF